MKTYIEGKIRTHCNKVCNNFSGLNLAKDDVEYESFTVIFIDSLLI